MKPTTKAMTKTRTTTTRRRTATKRRLHDEDDEDDGDDDIDEDDSADEDGDDGDDENEVEDDSGEGDDRPPTASATKKMTMIKITRTTTDESTKQSIGTKVWDPVVFPRRDLGAGLL